MTQRGQYPGKLSVLFLPMIDMSQVTCPAYTQHFYLYVGRPDVAKELLS